MATEKSQLNLQVMVGIGSGSQEYAKLFRGIENRISGRLRIVPDLLEIYIRKTVVYAGVFQSTMQQLICIIASVAAVSLAGFQNLIEVIGSDTSQKNILMQMRLDDQVYDPLLLNQCTAAIRTLSTHIIQPVIQIFFWDVSLLIISIGFWNPVRLTAAMEAIMHISCYTTL